MLPTIDERFEMRHGERLPIQLIFIEWLDGAYITGANWEIPGLVVSGVKYDYTSSQAVVEGGERGESYTGKIEVTTDKGGLFIAKVEISVV